MSSAEAAESNAPALPPESGSAERPSAPFVVSPRRRRGRRRKGHLRARVLVLAAMLPVVASVLGTAPIDGNIEALAAALGTASGASVSANDVRWEPSRGALVDLVRGRNVLFLARSGDGGARDVFRARVRVTNEGGLLGVLSVYNLTSTPLGDDHALVVRGHRAAFATSAFGQEQSVTLLDLAGAAPGEAASFSERTMRFLTNLQETGDPAGIRRADATLDPPGKRVGLEMATSALRIDVEGERAMSWTLDLASLEVVPAISAIGATKSGASLKVEASPLPAKKLVHWAVDTVRAVPWIGAAPIVWLEERAFAVKDTLKQTAFELGGGHGEVRADARALVAAPVLASDLASRDDGSWPPAPIQSIWKTPEPGEGEWVAPKVSWIKRLDVKGAPSAFMRTFVRPDEQRPYTRVLLVAMDMRRLDLQMEAGSEDPKPLTGPAGPGRLPRDPAISTKVVATFNGAFKTEHGFHGMMVQKRVLLPPQPNVATVVVLKDGRAGLGTWGPSKEVVGLRGIPADEIVSLRQNLDPLVDRGEVNPQKRSMWGFTLPGTSMQTERSGICVTPTGHLFYAWGDDVSGLTLAKGMKMAGCIYGMHLDMNPHHTGFLFANIDDLKAKKYKTELLSPDMEIPTDRYLEHSAKDFFFVMARDPSPTALEGGQAAWSVAPGTQPAPSWFPGLFEAEVVTSAGREERVSLFDVEAGRAEFRVGRGAAEPDLVDPSRQPGARAGASLEESEASRVLFALGVGVAHDKRPRGLWVRGRAFAPVKATNDTALLVVDGGALSIRRHDEALEISPRTDVVELPMLFAGNTVHPQAPSVPGAMRAALGTTETGRVLVARALAASDAALTAALKLAGCTRAVLLDRGAHTHAGAFDRAGTKAPPRAAYEETVLYGIATALKPRAFRFEADTNVAASK